MPVQFQNLIDLEDLEYPSNDDALPASSPSRNYGGLQSQSVSPTSAAPNGQLPAFPFPIFGSDTTMSGLPQNSYPVNGAGAPLPSVMSPSSQYNPFLPAATSLPPVNPSPPVYNTLPQEQQRHMPNLYVNTGAPPPQPSSFNPFQKSNSDVVLDPFSKTSGAMGATQTSTAVPSQVPPNRTSTTPKTAGPTLAELAQQMSLSKQNPAPSPVSPALDSPSVEKSFGYSVPKTCWLSETDGKGLEIFGTGIFLLFLEVNHH